MNGIIIFFYLIWLIHKIRHFEMVTVILGFYQRMSHVPDVCRQFVVKSEDTLRYHILLLQLQKIQGMICTKEKGIIY